MKKSEVRDQRSKVKGQGSKGRWLLCWLVGWLVVDVSAEVCEFIAPPVEGHVHASTILPRRDGGYLAAWFEGSKESAPDVAIWGAVRKAGVWQPKRQLAKIAPDAPHWNPVLRRGDDGRVQLFFKVGPNCAQWRTYVMESADDGMTWSAPQELVPGDGSGGRGPVKNKCLKLRSGRCLAGASREFDPSRSATSTLWRAFADISDDDGRTWRMTPPFPIPADAPKGDKLPFGVIQPTLWEDATGVHALLRATDGWIWRSDSADGGETWCEIYRTPLQNLNSGVDCVKASDGKVYLVLNGANRNPKGWNWGTRSHLEIRVSDDGGATWRLFRVLEDDGFKQPDGRMTEYSYPAIVEARPGVLAISYTSNRRQIAFREIVLCESAAGGLRAEAMRVLPPGSIRPEGALRERLLRQAAGLTGHAEALYRDIGESDWLTNAGRGNQYSWERGPYYARGLVALAFALDDPALKAKAGKWVDAVLASQKKSGDMGPRKDNWWANMIPLGFLRDWADATGDGRIVPFLERYFAYQETELDVVPLEKEGCWACARGGDEIDALYWLHEKTGDARWLGFAERIEALTADWTTYYRVGGDPGLNQKGRGGYRCHIVNFMQGLKFPALKWRRSGDDADRTAYTAAFDPDGWVMRKCGRPDRMINGSEPLTDRSASAGTELCAIVERILSCQRVLAVFGDAAVADDLEDVAYNSLAATVTADMKGIRYYLLLNQPVCVDKGLLFANNGYGSEVTGANCPGPHSGFGCCRSNWHVGWPKFVQTMWMRRENGLAAVLHGPSSVTAKLACGEVTLREETDYPRSGRVTVRVVKGEGRFPVFVRVPRWAKAADAGTFRRYERVWKVGDALELEFPMAVELSYWENDAVAIRRGPFVYSLRIAEDWRKVERYKVPYENAWIENFGGEFPRWEILPKTPWNYALVLKGGSLASAEVVSDGAELRVHAVRTEQAGWGYLRADAPGRAVDPPTSPVDRGVCTPEETVTLVPMCDTQLRITLFPWIRR